MTTNNLSLDSVAYASTFLTQQTFLKDLQSTKLAKKVHAENFILDLQM